MPRSQSSREYYDKLDKELAKTALERQRAAVKKQNAAEDKKRRDHK